jgi:hypothetical protein
VTYSKKHEELLDAWVAHEAAGAPDDDYAFSLLRQLEFYDKLEGVPIVKLFDSREADKELVKQSRQIAYEAACRQGFPLGPIPKVI